MTKLYVVESGLLNALAQIARRLHTEERMDGNEMRDAGHVIDAIVKACKDVEIPEEFFVG